MMRQIARKSKRSSARSLETKQLSARLRARSGDAQAVVRLQQLARPGGVRAVRTLRTQYAFSDQLAQQTHRGRAYIRRTV